MVLRWRASRGAPLLILSSNLSSASIVYLFFQIKNLKGYGCVIMIDLSCFSFFKTDTIKYDDACHLKKYGSNQVRSDMTPTSERMSHMEMIIDKLHFKNHVDKWCKVHCNPYDCEELKVT